MLIHVKRSNKIKHSLGDRIFSILNYVILSILALACVFPLFYVFMYSITPYEDYLANPLRLFPPEVTLTAYKELLTFPLMKTGYFSTIFVTVVGTTLNVFLLCITAYPLSKRNLKGRNVVMALITFTMFFNGGMIPNYMLVLMRNFVSAIPSSLEEAAYIDGANELQILRRVIVPLCKPALATFTLFHAVGHWNSYFNATMYINDRDKWPLMLIVREMVAESGTNMVHQSATVMEDLAQPFTLQMAIIIFTIVPILCVYPFVQKYFMQGMLLGSVKG